MAKHNYSHVHRELMSMQVGERVMVEVPSDRSPAYFQKVIHQLASRCGMEIATRSRVAGEKKLLLVTLVEVS